MYRDQWSEMFWPLFDKYGGYAVYSIGLEVLGFPPTFGDPLASQVLKVYKALPTY